MTKRASKVPAVAIRDHLGPLGAPPPTPATSSIQPIHHSASCLITAVYFWAIGLSSLLDDVSDLLGVRTVGLQRRRDAPSAASRC